MTAKLTGSQVRSAIALALAGLLTINEVLKSAAGIPGLHIPLGVTAAVQLIALGVTAFSRSLDAANSGNGAGVVNVGTTSTPQAQTANLGAPKMSAIEIASYLAPPAPSPVLETLLGILPPSKRELAEVVLSGLLTEWLKEKSTSLVSGVGTAADARGADVAFDKEKDSTPTPVNLSPFVAPVATPSVGGLPTAPPAIVNLLPALPPADAAPDALPTNATDTLPPAMGGQEAV